MATSPLFVADVATLKAKLRLSGVPAASNADDIIDEAILVVRTGLYRELGSSVVDSILATPFSENPTTANQLRRATANSVEVKWVKCELIRTLPTMFIDGNADQTQVYHDEALFRDSTQRQLDAECMRLMAEVEVALEELKGTTDPLPTRGVRALDVSPEIERPQPGDTIRFRRRCY